MGGATASLGVCLPAFSDFNPRSPWGERLIRRKNLFHGIPDFNPRSPWGERLCLRPIFARKEKPFQSTLPVGGATDSVVYQIAVTGISIHAPRGGSDQLRMRKNNENRNFNPRSPWGERLYNRSMDASARLFQSTLPVGGATYYGMDAGTAYQISIHAPRGGSDVFGGYLLEYYQDFNPRSPWGERPGLAGLGLPGSEISIHAPRGGSDF